MLNLKHNSFMFLEYTLFYNLKASGNLGPEILWAGLTGKCNFQLINLNLDFNAQSFCF